MCFYSYRNAWLITAFYTHREQGKADLSGHDMHKLSPLAMEKRAGGVGTWKDRQEENEKECGRSKRGKKTRIRVETKVWKEPLGTERKMERESSLEHGFL